MTAERSRPAAPLAGLLHEPRNLVGTECLRQLTRRHGLVGTARDPRLSLVALTVLLELLEQVSEAAAENAAGRSAAQEAEQGAFRSGPRHGACRYPGG